jgi:methionyl-tRNA synthetase
LREAYLNKEYYITTPIYYPDVIPGLQALYSAIAADCAARYRRMTGKEVFFVTGTDEHGSGVQKIAALQKKIPQDLVNSMAANFKVIFRKLQISHNRFVRTSDEDHIRVVEKVFNDLSGKGHIYRGEYRGWYCLSCESFWPDTLTRSGRCPKPRCGSNLEAVQEEGYFFRLSAFAAPVLEHLQNNPDFIRPEHHRAKVINTLREGLQDLCITRKGLIWGIPAPPDPGFTIYVWLDALLAYVSAAGYGTENFLKVWPADLHLIREDILAFHAIIWTALCLALEIPLPRALHVHGSLMAEGKVLSPSQRDPVNPVEIIDLYGPDAFRYYLLREAPLGQDLEFSVNSLVNRHKGSLANGLGNLFHRSITMLEKYRGGIVPEPSEKSSAERNLERVFRQVKNEYKKSMDTLDFREAIQSLWDLVDGLNRFIQETKAWELHRDGLEKRLDTVLYTLADYLRILTLLISPFMPRAAIKMWRSLGFKDSLWKKKFDLANPERMTPGQVIRKIKPLFPRSDEPGE